MKVLVLTYNPDDHRAEAEPYLTWMLNEHRMFGYTCVGWGCMTKNGVVPGVRALLLQQGPYDRGLFAEGEVIGEPTGAGGSNPSVRDRPWTIVPVLFSQLIDPRRQPFLYDAAWCESAGINLSQQASGMLVEMEAW
jgi:hypothetical protein